MFSVPVPAAEPEPLAAPAAEPEPLALPVPLAPLGEPLGDDPLSVPPLGDPSVPPLEPEAAPVPLLGDLGVPLAALPDLMSESPIDPLAALPLDPPMPFLACPGGTPVREAESSL